MAKITATGKRFGVSQTVECFMEDGAPVIEANGEYDEATQEHFNRLMETPPAIGGTYYPPQGSMLAAHSVLEFTFFDDRNVTVKVEGDIGEIPVYDEEGIVY
ncbi:MAG TPA: hypothetical protein GXX59_08280 [Syntrophomonadaceae bacterium]|nr:hypothetical protein [Syntrophomonadaceae bacterium]